MELKIKEEEYNALLKRKEVSAEVDHDGGGTPSRVDLRKAVAAKYGTKPDNVFVIGVHTMTGTQKAICRVQVYDEPEVGRRTVAKYIQTRNLPAEERKKLREQETKKEEAKPKEEKPKAEKEKQQSASTAGTEKINRV